MPQWWIPYVYNFVQRVQSLAQLVPFQVTSFVRSRAHNAAVGGVSDSQHLLGTAADLVPTGGTMDDLAAAAAQSGLFGYVLPEGDHVHVQLYPAGMIPAWIFDQVPT